MDEEEGALQIDIRGPEIVSEQTVDTKKPSDSTTTKNPYDIVGDDEPSNTSSPAIKISPKPIATAVVSTKPSTNAKPSAAAAAGKGGRGRPKKPEGEAKPKQNKKKAAAAGASPAKKRANTTTPKKDATTTNGPPKAKKAKSPVKKKATTPAKAKREVKTPERTSGRTTKMNYTEFSDDEDMATLLALQQSAAYTAQAKASHKAKGGSDNTSVTIPKAEYDRLIAVDKTYQKIKNLVKN